MIDYAYLYKKLNKRTPLKYDCGIICSGACCKSDEGEDETGMYLFPHEEDMFQNSCFRISESDFTYGGKKAKILFCDGICNRKMRPLSCRIFPLFPYITTFGDLKVVTDKRGFGVCPISGADVSDFNISFIRGVKHIGEYIMNDKEGFSFLYSLSRLIDDWFIY